MAEMDTMVARSAEMELAVPAAGDGVGERREARRIPADRNSRSSADRNGQSPASPNGMNGKPEREEEAISLMGMTPTSLARRLGPRS